jgi:hypothetical protein
MNWNGKHLDHNLILERLMLARYLLRSNPLIKKPISTFFKNRFYYTGTQLVEFRKHWYKLTEVERKKIASLQESPPCDDVYISKGDHFKEINSLFQARWCYQEAAKLNSDCKKIAELKIAELDKIEQTQKDGNLKKTDHNDEIRDTTRVYAGK